MPNSHQQQLDRLDDLRGRLESNLRAVDPGLFNRRPADGGWSAGQVLAHVIDAEGKSLAYVEKKIVDPEALRRRTLRQRLNGVVLALAMRSRFRFEAPPGVADPPETVDFDSLSQEWEEVRRGWRAFVAAYPQDLADRAVYRHPVAGRLTLGDCLRFMITHLQRHTRQIERLLEDRG